MKAGRSQQWRGRYGPPTMWTRHASRLIELLQELGGDREAMAARSGLTSAALGDLDGRVPLEAVYEAFEAAIDTTENPLLGIHVAKAVTVEDLDAMGYLMMTSRTMGEAMDRINGFADAFVSGERYRWFVTGDGVHHEFVPYGPVRPAHAHVAELVFYDIACNSSRLFGADVRPLEVRFSHRPGPGIDYDGLFGTTVRFDQPRYEVLFDHSVTEVELRNANPLLAPLVDRYIKSMLGELPPAGSLVARLVELIDRRLENGPPTVAEVAAEVAMSPRSLQRQLRNEGTTLTGLIDGARRAKASALIEAGVPIIEVTYLLGYADQAVFHRAFKRWTGDTPAAYRRRHRSPRPPS